MKTLNNQVQLIGNIGREVQLREFSNGTKLIRTSIATTDRYKNREDEYVSHTQWHTIIAWNKMAERMARMLSKGTHVAIQGMLVHRTYEDKNGDVRYTSEVKVHAFSKVNRTEKVAVPF